MNKEESKKKKTKHLSIPHYMTSTSKKANSVGVIKITSFDLKDKTPKEPPLTPTKPLTYKSPYSYPQKPNSSKVASRTRPKSMNLSATTPMPIKSPLKFPSRNPKSNSSTPKGDLNHFNVTQSTKHPTVHVTNFKDPKLKKETPIITPKNIKTPKSVKTSKTKHMSMSFDAATFQKARDYEEMHGKSMVKSSPHSDQQNNDIYHHHHHSESNNSINNSNNINGSGSTSSGSHHHHHHHHHHHSNDYFTDERMAIDEEDIFEYSLPAFTIPSKIPKINSIPPSSSSSSSISVISNNNNNNNTSESEVKYFSIPTLIDTPPTMLPDDLLDVPTLPPPPKYNTSDKYYLPQPKQQLQLQQPEIYYPLQEEDQQQQQQKQHNEEVYQYPQPEQQQEEMYYQQQQQEIVSGEYNDSDQLKTDRMLYEELRKEIYSDNNNNNNRIKSKKSSEITENSSYQYIIPHIILIQRWYRECRKRHQDFYNEINRQPFALDGDHSYEDKNNMKNETFSPNADDEFFSALNEGILF